MGVLDDAIKQHLDLKRRHGASEDELRKQEAEALGPGRREAPAAPADDGDSEGELVEGAAPEEALEAPAVDEAPAVEEAASLEVEPDEVTREESLEAPVGEADARPQAPEPAPEAEPPEPEPSEDEEEEGEDVLEETPDFLQETPEHDRLWFEQRPPRDFDFDE